MPLTRIKFSSQALNLFNSEILEYGRIETGGVLIGNTSEDTIYVEKASNGGTNAIHELLYFRADPNFIDMFIDMEVANSKCQLRYLGEWHTHPEVIPAPSIKDLQSLNEIADSSDDFCILLIIGNKDFSPGAFIEQSISLIQENGNDNVYVLEASDIK
ncbi:Mov34/MPN/PAD-1 family protein [Draconibacterium sp. IB214405]|uniref:Mov34/MPN/PAD-1 family protein n=1 Tax=Draconibacterium sp. IB214405 TaxID=3097352 RepID=UPI002A1605D3|nr:Mov34/MPN/PAD-1 family protein [Draconibacterium sp. IB214405]MDX8339768.1 Mov34/MPN/PAD-1 family protein [Draconibacterium sp. IB214405]